MREVAQQFVDTLRTAYPAGTADAYRALTEPYVPLARERDPLGRRPRRRRPDPRRTAERDRARPVIGGRSADTRQPSGAA